MSTDGRVSGGTRTLNSAEPYAQAEWTVGRLSLVPGARLSWNEQWGSYTSPRLGLRFQADSQLTVRASAGRGFRAPDFKELYLDFTNNSAFYSVAGNPDLRPEHSDNISVGLDWSGDRLFGRGHMYWNELHDFIETIPLASSGGFSRFTYSNVNRAMTRGLELESGVTLGTVRAQAGYAHLTSLDRESQGPLLGQPANSGRLLLSGPVPLGISATATAVYTGRTPMQLGDEGAVTDWRDAYTRLDLRAARRLLGRANVSVGVDNLFNAQPARWADVTARQVYVGVALTLRPAAAIE
jgi:outer membrane receptor for ferrienterochelin and colicins